MRVSGRGAKGPLVCAADQGSVGGNPTRSGDRLAVAAAAATTIIPRPPTTRPTHDATASWSVYAYAPARLRRAYALPRAPGLVG